MAAVISERASRRDWIGLAVIALPCVVYAMDLTVLNLAIPSISRELAPSAAELLWIIDIYGFMVAGMLITMGTLGDRIGRRRLLMCGAAAFGIASLIAAFSTSAAMLIAMRALLGIAGATLAPSTLSLIRNMFRDENERRFAIGVWVASYSAGGAIGPIAGGLVLEFYWWGAIFLLSVPVMALLLIAGPLLLPEYRNENAGRLDVTSAAMSIAAVLATIYGVKRVAEDGIVIPAVVAIAAGIAIGAAFVRRQRRLADPLIDLRFFRDRAFSASVIVYGVGCLVAFGMFVYVSQYLQSLRGMSPLVAGLWSLPFAAAFTIGAMIAPRLAQRVGAPRVITAGLWLADVGFAMMVTVGADSPIPWLVAAFFVYALGLAPVFTLATDLVVGCAPPEHAGAASAISETSSELGGALGIALLGSLGAAIYRHRLSDIANEGARNTLGAAIDVAQRMGGADGASLAAAASEAFVSGMRASALAAALVTAVMAWLTAAPLRRVPKGSARW